MSNNSMLVLLMIALFFSCSFAQEQEIFDHDDNIFPGDELMVMELGSGSGEEPSSEDNDSINLEDILRELSAVLNNDLRRAIFNIQAEMKDMKDKMADISDLKNELTQMKTDKF